MELEILPDYSEFTQIYESKIVRERGFTVFRQNFLLLFSSLSIRLLSKQIFLPLPSGSAAQEQSTANNYERSIWSIFESLFSFPFIREFFIHVFYFYLSFLLAGYVWSNLGLFRFFKANKGRTRSFSIALALCSPFRQ